MYKIGLPKEIKEYESRVSLVPNDVHRLLDSNDNILIYVQTNAGIEAGYSDNDYIAMGAIIVDTIEDIYSKANIIVKVKEPQEKEYDLINSTHSILSFFHFAGNNALITAMINSKAKCYAYETIQDDNGKYPILSPMSVIAGRKSMIIADKFRNNIRSNINKNIYAFITIIGVGNVGKAAADQAILLGYKTINLIDNDYEKIKKIEQSNPTIFKSYEMNANNLKKLMRFSDIVISSIYNNGSKASKIITTELLDSMTSPSSIIIDVAIDQGGTTEKSIPTTFKDPFIKYKNTNIYCVANIPSSEPTEASIKLSNTIYPYLHSLISSNNHNSNAIENKYLNELNRGLYVNK
jgi:alanine dehydrogenase